MTFAAVNNFLSKMAADKRNNQSKQNKSGIKDDVDDLKKVIHKNKLQNQVLKKSLKTLINESKNEKE